MCLSSEVRKEVKKMKAIVKQATAKKVAKPSKQASKVITKKQAEEFSRVKKNYNARIGYGVRKWNKMLAEPASYEVLSRTQVVPVKMYKKASEITTKKEYTALMKIMRQDKTKKYKAKRSSDIRDTMVYVIENAYFPTPEELARLKKLVARMTDEDIIRFRLENKDLVGDYFEAYKKTIDASWGSAGDESRMDGLLAVLEGYSHSDKRVKLR